MAGTTTDRRLGVNASAAVKVPCKAATTANIALSGEQTIDGVSCVDGDRVLVKNQTDASKNGIYEVGTSTWQRTRDWDGALDIKQGTFVYVHSGSTNIGFWYVSTSDTITPGTTAVIIAKASSVLAEVSVFSQTLLDDTTAGAWRTTLDVNSATDLANTADTAKGDALIGGKRTLINATSFTLHNFNENRIIDVATDFGVIADSNGTTGNGTDNTVAMQNAINAAILSAKPYKIKLPEGVVRVTSPLLISGALCLSGEGVSPYDTATGTRGNGSWLYFDHTGKGITIDGTGILSGIICEYFGTFRNQPAPGASWSPNAHDYDIYIDNADIYIKDLMLLNPTKGIYLTNGTAGRLEIDRLRGQAFQTMVRVAASYDVCKINNLHVWPFWKDDSNVNAYTEQNLDALYLERCDNPYLLNIFTIFARAGIRFGQTVNGKTSKVHAVNLDFDRGAFGIWGDSTITSGVTGQFVNFTHQGETGLTGSKAIFIEGNNSELEFVNSRTDYTNQNGIRIFGTGNVVILNGQTTIKNYNQIATSFPAIEVDTNNTIRIGNYPIISGDGGSGGRYGGSGTIYVNDWRSYSPTVTSTTGTITTLGTVAGRYKRIGNTLYFAVDISITTNGTGAGAVRATLPDTGNTQNMSAVGREVSAGKMLQGYMPSGLAYVDISNYDNTYPGADGYRLVVNGFYRTA